MKAMLRFEPFKRLTVEQARHSREAAERQPRHSRETAERQPRVQPRDSRETAESAAERQPRDSRECSRETAEVQPRHSREVRLHTVEQALEHRFFESMTYRIVTEVAVRPCRVPRSDGSFIVSRLDTKIAVRPVDAATIDFEHAEVSR